MTPTKFSEIDNATDLVSYLNASERLDNSDHIYHYTTLPTVISMFKSKTWHLGNAEKMNDHLEYENGDKQRWKNIFFSSFMAEDKESIGMWSMYSQPWENGVKIAIPRAAARKWIRNIKEIFEIDLATKQLTGNTMFVEQEHLILSAVAYSDADSHTVTKNNKDVLRWSNVSNNNIVNAVRIPELTGFIKDMAWSYEKEMRIRAEFKNIHDYRRIAISLPEEVMETMTITASPLFKGNLVDKLQREISRQLYVEKSLFTGRLNIRTICEGCDYKTQKTVLAQA